MECGLKILLQRPAVGLQSTFVLLTGRVKSTKYIYTEVSGISETTRQWARMGFAVRVRSAGQNYGPTCHQRDRADVTEFVTLVRLSSLAWAARWQDINVGNPLWRRALLWFDKPLVFLVEKPEECRQPSRPMLIGWLFVYFGAGDCQACMSVYEKVYTLMNNNAVGQSFSKHHSTVVQTVAEINTALKITTFSCLVVFSDSLVVSFAHCI